MYVLLLLDFLCSPPLSLSLSFSFALSLSLSLVYTHFPLFDVISTLCQAYLFSPPNAANAARVIDSYVYALNLVLSASSSSESTASGSASSHGTGSSSSSHSLYYDAVCLIASRFVSSHNFLASAIGDVLILVHDVPRYFALSLSCDSTSPFLRYIMHRGNASIVFILMREYYIRCCSLVSTCGTLSQSHLGAFNGEATVAVAVAVAVVAVAVAVEAVGAVVGTVIFPAAAMPSSLMRSPLFLLNRTTAIITTTTTMKKVKNHRRCWTRLTWPGAMNERGGSRIER